MVARNQPIREIPERVEAIAQPRYTFQIETDIKGLLRSNSTARNTWNDADSIDDNM